MKYLRSIKPPAQPPQYSFDKNTWNQHTAHLDPEDREWLLDGIESGFDIYVDESENLERRKVKNLRADTLQKLRITEWIIKNIEKKAIWGPFDPDDSNLPSELRNFRVSPVGCVRKGIHFNIPDEDKEWRVIHHLSHPRNDVSVNSVTLKEWSTVSYVSFREVVSMVNRLGPDALLWTVDAKDAYLRVPIKKRCMKLMCFIWGGKLFAFTSLSFGLTSAPRIYTLFADHVLSVAEQSFPGLWIWNGHRYVFHYIDDFFGGAPAGYGRLAKKQFQSIIETFRVLGIPTKPEKCVNPSTRTRILGFIYDTVAQRLFIPDDKKQVMLSEIQRCLDPATQKVSRSDIQSLIGKLRWFSNCLWAGPAFVRRMEREVNRSRNGVPMMWIKTDRLRDDLIWWLRAIKFNEDGVRFSDILRDPSSGEIQVWTDASTDIGMGGWNNTGQWFQYRWDSLTTSSAFSTPSYPDIYWKEMCAIATACEMWGEQWKGRTVTFWCDNEACVHSIIKRSCTLKRADVMVLIRIIADLANRHHFIPYIVHIPGKLNLTADALSRYLPKLFHDDTAGVKMAGRASKSEYWIRMLMYDYIRFCDLALPEAYDNAVSEDELSEYVDCNLNDDPLNNEWMNYPGY